MRIPSVAELERNLRETLVVKAEVLFLSMGGELGVRLATMVTGVPADESSIPTDAFDEANLQQIQLAPLAISRSVLDLRSLLVARSLGYGPTSDALDGDYVEQEFLDLLELYLSALPEMTFGGCDWGSCRHGALRDLLLAGRAWHHLVRMIDEGTQGDFDIELLTATDLALIADIEVRSLRNLVGPQRQLRSQELYQKRKTKISERGFAVINRFDALDWLIRRKGFSFARLRPGLLASRIERIEDPLQRGRAALIAAFVLGQALNSLSKALDESELALKAIGDGQGATDVANRLASYVVQFDQGQVPLTAPALLGG